MQTFENGWYTLKLRIQHPKESNCFFICFSSSRAYGGSLLGGVCSPEGAADTGTCRDSWGARQHRLEAKAEPRGWREKPPMLGRAGWWWGDGRRGEQRNQSRQRAGTVGQGRVRLQSHSFIKARGESERIYSGCLFTIQFFFLVVLVFTTHMLICKNNHYKRRRKTAPEPRNLLTSNTGDPALGCH